MNARSALFDLYGDHLRERGGRAPISALVRLMAALGI
ncbi:PaaX family transcriptional regulator, partial [Actinomadura adrarensis]